MARYIDIDKFAQRINVSPAFKNLRFEGELCQRIVLDILGNFPTADVVEVVRCRNCKHAYFRYNTKDTLQEIYACEKRPTGRTHKKVSGDFFCKHGQRKEGD